jgi:hypothetical protein
LKRQKKRRKKKKKKLQPTLLITLPTTQSQKIRKFNILEASVVEFKHTLKDKKGINPKFASIKIKIFGTCRGYNLDSVKELSIK